METTELKAGRELDERIAREVMGWTHIGTPEETHDKEWRGIRSERELLTVGGPAFWEVNQGERIPAYSSDIAAAWEVLETAWKESGYAKVMRLLKWDHKDCFWLKDKPYGCQYGEATEIVWAKTAPLAICLAALKMVEGKEPANVGTD